MREDTLKKIEKLFSSAENLDPKQKEELLNLTGKLREELDTLAKTCAEDADSIAGFAKLTAHESLKAKQNKELLSHSSKGLEASVREFSASNPELTKTIRAILNTLSNLGI